MIEVQSMYFRIFAIMVLVTLYSILFYLQYTHRILIDFSSLYFGSESLSKGINPYRVLTTSFFPLQKKLPTNLNPPCVLWLFRTFVPLGYYKALVLWTSFSMVAGIKAASITYKILKQNKQFSIQKFDYWLIYFSLYPVFMNTVVSQIGFFLAFFILQGYDYAQRGKQWHAGFLWGIISAFKLFPLLLIIYAYFNRQNIIILMMLLCFITLSLLPLIDYYAVLYQHYYHILHRVLWYGDNWNASIYGYIFRIFVNPNQAHLADLVTIKIVYIFIFILVLAGYIWRSKKFIEQKNELAAFNLTLISMLLLSPLGWLYYFPILLLPAYHLWNKIQDGYNKIGIVYYLTTYFALALLACPLIYIMSLYMPQISTRLTLFSAHFYGLLLLAIAQTVPAKASRPSYAYKDVLLFNRVLLFILIWGVLVLGYYIISTFLNP